MKHSHHVWTRSVKCTAILSIVVLSVTGCAGWGQQISALRQFDLSRPGLTQYAGPQRPATSPLIEASGTIDARGVAVVAELGGRVMRVTADEGEKVARGQVLVQ